MGPGQSSKRAFVKVLLRIAALYRLVLNVNRDSQDAELNSAFRRVAAKCHPDKGGSTQHRRTDRQTDRQTNRQTGRQTDRQTDRQADRQTDRQTERQTGRQPNRQTDRQAGSQTEETEETDRRQNERGPALKNSQQEDKSF